MKKQNRITAAPTAAEILLRNRVKELEHDKEQLVLICSHLTNALNSSTEIINDLTGKEYKTDEQLDLGDYPPAEDTDEMCLEIN